MNKMENPRLTSGETELFVIDTLTKSSPLSFRDIQFASPYSDTIIRTAIRRLIEKKIVCATESKDPHPTGTKGNLPLVYSLIRKK